MDATPARLDVAAATAALTAALRRLAPEPTVVPIIKTERPFYGARVGDLRRVARGWLRDHRGADPRDVAGVADRLWATGVREEQLVACFLLDGDQAALAATDPGRVWDWLPLLDNWETTDQLGMHVLGPLVALDTGARFAELERMVADPHRWTRRVALVACTRLVRVPEAAALWPRVAGLLLVVAGDREAALPKAISWVLRAALECCGAEVAGFLDRHGQRLPALAVRETRAKLATGTKRPRRGGGNLGGGPAAR